MSKIHRLRIRKRHGNQKTDHGWKKKIYIYISNLLKAKTGTVMLISHIFFIQEVAANYSPLLFSVHCSKAILMSLDILWFVSQEHGHIYNYMAMFITLTSSCYFDTLCCLYIHPKWMEYLLLYCNPETKNNIYNITCINSFIKNAFSI